MTFEYSLRVEDGPNEDNSNFSRDVFARMFLDEVFRDAIVHKNMMLLKYLAANKGVVAKDDPYFRATNRDIERIEAIQATIKCIPSNG